jgi:hypothetical protein
MVIIELTLKTDGVRLWIGINRLRIKSNNILSRRQ